MNEGILGYPPVFTKQSFINRQNPKIYSVFSHLLQRKDLWVSIDRYGFFRPTKGVMINGKKVDRIDWKTEPNIHLDMNPWWYYDNTSTSKPDAGFFKSYKILDKFCLEYNHSGKASDNQLKLQGLLNFIDNRVEDGGSQNLRADKPLRFLFSPRVSQAFGRLDKEDKTKICQLF